MSKARNDHKLCRQNSCSQSFGQIFILHSTHATVATVSNSQQLKRKNQIKSVFEIYFVRKEKKILRARVSELVMCIVVLE